MTFFLEGVLPVTISPKSATSILLHSCKLVCFSRHSFVSSPSKAFFSTAWRYIFSCSCAFLRLVMPLSKSENRLSIFETMACWIGRGAMGTNSFSADLSFNADWVEPEQFLSFSFKKSFDFKKWKRYCEIIFSVEVLIWKNLLKKVVD